MSTFKNLLLIISISLVMVVSACGGGSTEIENDEVAKESETEEVNEREDENVDREKEESITEEENNDEIKVTKEDKEKVTSSKTGSREVEKKSTRNDEPQSSIKKNDTKKAAKSSSSTKQKKDKPKSNNSTQTKPKKEPKEEKVEQTVTVAVSIPSDVKKGSGLSATAVTIKDGDTVLDASLKTSLQIDYSGSGGTAYIKGINGLNEFDEGPLSGWLVKVDGTLINRSAGSYEVKANQKIEWVYTTDY